MAYQNYQWRKPTRVVLPGAIRTASLDALGRPTRIKNQAIGSGSADAPQGAIIMDYRYQYDAAGNITQRETGNGIYSYGYDALDRLTHATPPGALQQDPVQPEPDKLPVEAYSYDPVHNRTSSAHQPGQWQYNANNQLQQWGISQDLTRYQYGANGHTIERTIGDPQAPTSIRQFHYNAAERLSEVTENGQTIASYQYDPMGRRIKKTTAQGSTWYQYADQGLIAEYTESGSLTRAYGWQAGGLWGTDPLWLADITGSTWTLHFYHNDHLGTPQRLTDTSGALVWSAISEAFGKTTPTVELVRNPLRFPGQYHDPETGTHYNYFRDYQPTTGRYIQSDPISLRGGINLLIYPTNPITSLDNSGLAKWNGTITSGGVSVFIGGSLAVLNLKSECKCDVQYEINIVVIGPTLGVSIKGFPPFGGSVSKIALTDGRACPTPGAFNGKALWLTADIAIGGGVGCALYALGLANVIVPGSADCGLEAGLGGGLNLSFGTSTVTSIRPLEGCEECR